MTDNYTSNWLVYVPVLTALIMGVWGLLRHVSSSITQLRGDLEPEIKAVRTEFITKCESNYNLHEVKIEALRKEGEQRMERVALTESKARHDLNNAITAQLVKLEQQVSRIGEQAVRKEDLGRVERAVDTLLAKVGNTEVISAKVEALTVRLDKFLDSWERRQPGD